jgi:hypothetical protein
MMVVEEEENDASGREGGRMWRMERFQRLIRKLSVLQVHIVVGSEYSI